MLGIIVDLSETRKLIVIDLLAGWQINEYFRIPKFFTKITIWKLTMDHTGSGTKL